MGARAVWEREMRVLSTIARCLVAGCPRSPLAAARPFDRLTFTALKVGASATTSRLIAVRC